MWEEGHKGAKQRNMRKKSCIDNYKQRRPSYVPGVHSLAFHTAVFVFLSFHFVLGEHVTQMAFIGAHWEG